MRLWMLVPLLAACLYLACKPRTATQLSSSEGESADAEAVAKRVAFASTCEQALGVRVPDVSCLGPGTYEVPVTYTGEDGVTKKIVDRRASGKPLAEGEIQWSGPDQTCDRPQLIDFGREGGCSPHARVGRWDVGDTQWVMVCRSYDVKRKDVGIFTDIALIGVNAKTGATCFFNSPLKEIDVSAGLPNPRAGDPKFWRSPDGFSCPACHANDPWLHSPWIDQVRLGNGQPIVPFAPTKYAVVGKAAFSFYAEDGDFKVLRIKASAVPDDAERAKLGACLSCHKMARRKVCGMATTVAPHLTGKSSRLVEFLSPAGKKFPLSHWMPTDGKRSMDAVAMSEDEWREEYGASMAFIDKCCTDSDPRCEWVSHGTVFDP